MEKKIIFIGGTVRSGTTLLNLIIANDEKALALGEIFWLFNPKREKHFDLINEIKKDDKWQRILNGGKKNLFQNLEMAFPEINIFVDSSKDPFWIRYHEIVNKSKFDIKNVLIYKTPEEFAQSKLKRGETNWPKVYVNFHKRYFSLINDFYAISYFDLINDDDIFLQMLKYLNLNCSLDRRLFWNKKHEYNFFGSGSIHKSKSNDSNDPLRKELKYDGIQDSNVIKVVLKEKEMNKDISLVFDTLVQDNHNLLIQNDIQYNAFMLMILNYKDRVTLILGRIFRR